MKIELIDPETLKSAAYNPRQISRDELNKLIKSIKQFGFVDPALVRKQDNMIVGGHQRVKAAIEMGLKEIPVVFLDITENDAKLLNVALNKISGDWDEDKLTELLSELKFFDDVDELLTGFDEDELDKLLADLEEPQDGLTDDDAVPDQVESKCKLGQLWQLGDHRLLCGDSTNLDHVKRLMDGNKADMVFTDPPYNVSIGTIKHPKFKQREIKNDSMSDQEYKEFCEKFIKILKRVTIGCLYVCGAQHKDGRIMFTKLDENLHSSTTIIWVKDVFTLGRGKYQNKYEPIWFGWNESGTKFSEDRNLVNVWEHDRPKVSKLHPTMKPVDLIINALDDASVKNDLVLDIFLGSGSTLIACEKMNRICYGMELDPHYCDVIIKRWEDYTGNRAELINGSL